MADNRLTQVAKLKLPPELDHLPEERKQQKINASGLGIGVAVIGGIILLGAVYLFVQSVPAIVAGQITLKSAPIIIAGVVAVAGLAVLVLGASITDPETVLPVLKAIFAMALQWKSAGKAS